MNKEYDAYISYSHHVDDDLANEIEKAIISIGKPWYSLRKTRIFRDTSSLSASPSLWGTVQDKIEKSKFFILLASPESANSMWVQKEIEFWISKNGIDNLLIVLTVS